MLPLAIRPGQVWRPYSPDDPLYGKQKLITAIDEEGYAVCRNVGADEEAGRASRIRLDRLRPGSGGYQLDFNPALPGQEVTDEIIQVQLSSYSLMHPLLDNWVGEAEETLVASFVADSLAMELTSRGVIAYSVIGTKEVKGKRREWHWCEAQGFVVEMVGNAIRAYPASTREDLETFQRLRVDQSSFNTLLREGGAKIKESHLMDGFLAHLNELANAHGYQVVVGE
jgi:hypothetical protein